MIHSIHIPSLAIFLLVPTACTGWILRDAFTSVRFANHLPRRHLLPGDSQGLGVTTDPRFGTEASLTGQDDSNDLANGHYDENRQTQRLRFGGVGRLYAESGATASTDTVLDRLDAATVVVVGLGGVGSWAAEALCRSGIGHLVLIDLDDICLSNTNRQLHATVSTIGAFKIDEMKCRLTEIAPDCQVDLIHDFVSSENVHELLKRFVSENRTTVVLDAIDGGAVKASLLGACTDLHMPVVTCGGAAGKTSPTQTVCEDLTIAQGDKLLAQCKKHMRRFYGFPEGVRSYKRTRTKKWNIDAVYSKQAAKSVSATDDDTSSLRRCDGALGTACFVTGTFGFVAAGCIVDKIARNSLKPPRR